MEPHKHDRMFTWLARLLFALWILDEAWCYTRRNDPPDAPQGSYPKTTALILMPWIWATRLPAPIRAVGLLVQLIGLVTTVLARRQLIGANSFGWSSQAATQPQRDGWYRYIEHPIYTGIHLQIVGWSATNPIVLLVPLLIRRAAQIGIQKERDHLEQLGVQHRGIDSWYWDLHDSDE